MKKKNATMASPASPDLFLRKRLKATAHWLADRFCVVCTSSLRFSSCWPFWALR